MPDNKTVRIEARIKPEEVRRTLEKGLFSSVRIERVEPSKGHRDWMHSVAK